MLLRACIVLSVFWEYSEPEGSCCFLVAFWALPLHCCCELCASAQGGFPDSTEHWGSLLLSKPNLLQMLVTFPENHTHKGFPVSLSGSLRSVVWDGLTGACPAFLPPPGCLHMELPKTGLLPSLGLLKILNWEISLKLSIKIMADKRFKQHLIPAISFMEKSKVRRGQVYNPLAGFSVLLRPQKFMQLLPKAQRFVVKMDHSFSKDLLPRIKSGI